MPVSQPLQPVCSESPNVECFEAIFARSSRMTTRVGAVVGRAGPVRPLANLRRRRPFGKCGHAPTVRLDSFLSLSTSVDGDENHV
ncbi:hypothetical protein SCOR_23930 [Sulfidibacter corallicola]